MASELQEKEELDLTLGLSMGAPKPQNLSAILKTEFQKKLEEKNISRCSGEDRRMTMEATQMKSSTTSQQQSFSINLRDILRMESQKKRKKRSISSSCSREHKMTHQMKSSTTSQQQREGIENNMCAHDQKRREIDAKFSNSNSTPCSFPAMPILHQYSIPQSLPMQNLYRPVIERALLMSSKVSSSQHSTGLEQGGSTSNSYNNYKFSHAMIVDKPQLQSSSMTTGGDQLASSTAKSILVSNVNAPIERVTSVNKPPTSPSRRSSDSLAMMPRVTTKGNGPNGKSISGILYRYMESEVCIVCVCHGSSFSPAEFVEHAGGTSMDHPMKQIFVVPSS